MTSFPEYLLRALLLAACLSSVGVASTAWQRRFLPDWEASDRLLVRVVFGLATVTVVSYIVGSVGLFDLPALSLLLLASGPAAWWLWGRKAETRSSSARPPVPPLWTLGVLAVGLAILIGTWFVPINQAFHTGMAGTDTLWYHLPTALRFHQTGWLLKINFNEPLFETYFYPLLGSVYHGFFMNFFDRDIASPLLNLAFLLGTLLAAASIGRRMNVAVAATLGAGVVFGTDAIVSGSAGGAMVDTPSTFFFVASVALLLRGFESRATLFASGLALGMAIGTKLTVAIPAAAMLIALTAFTAKERRLKTAGVFLGGIALTAGFWFLRDLLATGNPLPLLHLPFFPSPAHTGAELDSMRPLSAFLTDTHVMLDTLPSAWHNRLGPLWPLMMLGGLAGGVLAIAKPPQAENARAWRIAGIVAVAAFIGYFFTPGTAAGPPGGPMRGLLWDTRFVAPAVALGLALLPCVTAQWLRSKRDLMVPLLGLLGAVTALANRGWDVQIVKHEESPLLPPSIHTGPQTLLQNPGAAITMGILLVAAGFGIWVLVRTLKGRARMAGALIGMTVAIGSGWMIGVDYTHGRNWGYYAQLPAHGKLKIGIVGTASVFNQYLMSGGELQNKIVFIGVHGPHGSFRSVTNCTGIRRLINRGNFDYVVVAPDRDLWRAETVHNPLIDWLRNYPGLKKIRFLPGLPKNRSAVDPYKKDRFVLYKVTGKLKSWQCGTDAKRAKLAARAKADLTG